MIINSVTTIYFSPTGTTKKIVNSIVRGMNISNNTNIDLTSFKVRNNTVPFIEGDIVIIGVPVYEERVPNMLNAFLNSLNGNGKPIVLVAVYGNFGDGIALNELDFIAKKSRFKVVAAGSFIGEHSFSTKAAPVQEGRPDLEDLNIAEEFGKSIIQKMSQIENLNNIKLEIPRGSLPLMAKILPKDSARLFTKTPSADMAICNHCGVCAKLCPMNAIKEYTLEINKNDCIRCFSCVKRCPKKARQIIYRPRIIVNRILRMKNKIKRNSKIYLSSDI